MTWDYMVRPRWAPPPRLDSLGCSGGLPIVEAGLLFEGFRLTAMQTVGKSGAEEAEPVPSAGRAWLKGWLLSLVGDLPGTLVRAESMLSRFQLRLCEYRLFALCLQHHHAFSKLSRSQPTQVTGLVLSLQYEPMLPWKHLRCTHWFVGPRVWVPVLDGLVDPSSSTQHSGLGL